MDDTNFDFVSIIIISGKVPYMIKWPIKLEDKLLTEFNNWPAKEMLVGENTILLTEFNNWPANEMLVGENTILPLEEYGINQTLYHSSNPLQL